MNLSHSEAEAIRKMAPPNSDSGIAAFTVAGDRGWSDAQFADYINSQEGTGDDWTAAKVAAHREWLVNSHLWSPAAPVVSGDYLMLGGKRYNITPA